MWLKPFSLKSGLKGIIVFFKTSLYLGLIALKLLKLMFPFGVLYPNFLLTTGFLKLPVVNLQPSYVNDTNVLDCIRLRLKLLSEFGMIKELLK